MTSTATTRGKYRKQGLGDGLNAWGLSDGLNGLFDVMDDAIHGVEVMALTGNKTLTSTNYAANESRYRVLQFTDSSLSAAPIITIPATENWWLVDNTTAYVLTFSNGADTATVPANRQAFVWTDGTTVYSLGLFKTGDQTYAGALSYTYSTTTTDADPGSGFLRLDNATPASATGIYASDNEANGVDVSAYLLSFDDGTSTVEGQLILRSVDNAGVFYIYGVTAVTDSIGYVDITVSYISGAGSLVNGETVLLAFLRTGDQGDTGAQGPAGGTLSAETFTATAGQTTFTTSGGYATGALEVHLNGVLLKSTTDYTATNGSTIVLTSPAATGDILYARTFANATTFSQDPSAIAVTGGTIDGTVIGGTTPATGTFTTLNATGGGALTGTWSNLGTVTTVDINGGTVDGAVIGGASAATGTFTTLNATGGGALTGTWSNLGTVTTVDINGGTVDGAVIGGASAAAGTFTTLAGTTSVTSPLVTNAGTLALSATGTNVVTVSTNATERMRIDSSGSVHIGTVATYPPVGGLNITGPTGEAAVGVVLGELFRITDTGSFGMTLQGSATSTMSYRFGYEGASGNAKGAISYIAASDAMTLTTNGSERLRVDSSGRLLIGTTATIATNEILHARKSSGVVGTLYNSGSTGEVLRLYHENSAVDALQIWGGGVERASISSPATTAGMVLGVGGNSAVIIESDLTVDFRKPGTAASVAANFSATNYIIAKVDGATVYIPYATSTW